MMSACSKRAASDDETPSSASITVDPVPHPERFIAPIETITTTSSADAPSASLASDVIPISTVADLRAIDNNPAATYVLVNDIDLTAASAGVVSAGADGTGVDGAATSAGVAGTGSNGSTNSNSAQFWTPLCDDSSRAFTGTLDGQGFVITGLYLQQEAQLSAGLFAYIGSSGVVRNLGIERAVLAPAAGEFLGGIAIQNLGSIENCYVTGLLTTTASTDRSVTAGGICADNRGLIRDCYFAGTIELTLPDGSSGKAGGIAADHSGEIQHCFVLGEVSTTAGSALAGGIATVAHEGMIADCFVGVDVRAVSTVEQTDVGGVCARIDGPDTEPGAVITRCLIASSVYGSSPRSIAAGGVCGYGTGFGEISGCIVLARSITAQGSMPLSALIIWFDDGYWEEGMPEITCEMNYVLDTLWGGVMGLSGAEHITLAQAGNPTTYEALGWDMSGGFWLFAPRDTLAGFDWSSSWLPADIEGLPLVLPVSPQDLVVPNASALLDEMRDALAAARDAAGLGGSAGGGSGSGAGDGGHGPDGSGAGNGSQSGKPSDSSASAPNPADTIDQRTRPFISDVEGEVGRIRAIWTADRSAIEGSQYEQRSLRAGVTAYYANGDLRNIEVTRGTDGLDYARIFQYDHGRLIFAYYEGADQNRLYFSDDFLFRWRSTSSGGEAVDHDNESSSTPYLDWEKRALAEAYRLMNES
jgi:hypothetical protein